MKLERAIGLVFRPHISLGLAVLHPVILRVGRSRDALGNWLETIRQFDQQFGPLAA